MGHFWGVKREKALFSCILIHCSVEKAFQIQFCCLAVTDRRESWTGPRQYLSPASFSPQNAHFQLSFSVRANQAILAKWKLHMMKDEEEEFLSLFSEEIVSIDWKNYTVTLDIDDSVSGADSVELMFEGSPAAANFSLDNISLLTNDGDDSWKEEANDRIEKLRKRTVELNFHDIDARELVLEIEQTSHLFPFGQAVDSAIIGSCYETGRDDNYCSYVRNNFNMITDTYRLDQRDLVN